MPRIPPWTKPFCCVRSSRNGSETSLRPGSMRDSVAPIRRIAFCRPKLARQRSTNAGSCGTKRAVGAFMRARARLIDVYVNVNPRDLASGALQLLADAPLEGLQLGQLGLDVGLLLQQAGLVRVQHRQETLEL